MKYLMQVTLFVVCFTFGAYLGMHSATSKHPEEDINYDYDNTIYNHIYIYNTDPKWRMTVYVNGYKEHVKVDGVEFYYKRGADIEWYVDDKEVVPQFNLKTVHN